MNITTQAIEYALNLAKHLHFGKAAKASHTSQPNLSAQIKSLEKQLGIQLFERSNKAVHITETGKRVIEILEKVRENISELKTIHQDPFSGTLKIGLFPTLGPYILPTIIPKIKQKLPKLTLEITEEKTQTLIQKLKEGEIDTALLASPIPKSTLSSIPLFDDPFYLAVSKDNPLAEKKKPTLEDIKTQPILLLEEGHCLRDQSLEVCHNDIFKTNTTFESTSLETIRAMVAAGTGITFIPKLCITPNPLITYIPLNTPKFSRKIALYHRPTTPKKDLLKCLATIFAR